MTTKNSKSAGTGRKLREKNGAEPRDLLEASLEGDTETVAEMAAQPSQSWQMPGYSEVEAEGNYFYLIPNVL